MSVCKSLHCSWHTQTTHGRGIWLRNAFPITCEWRVLDESARQSKEGNVFDVEHANMACQPPVYQGCTDTGYGRNSKVSKGMELTAVARGHRFSQNDI